MSTKGWFAGLLSIFLAVSAQALPASKGGIQPPPGGLTTPKGPDKVAMTKSWLAWLDNSKSKALASAGSNLGLVSKINAAYVKQKARIQAGHFPSPFVGGHSTDAWTQWFYGQRTANGPNGPGTIPTSAVDKAFGSALKNNPFKAAPGHTPSAIPSWKALGPAGTDFGQLDGSFLDYNFNLLAPASSSILPIHLGVVSGRVTSIAVDPTDPSGNSVYIGTANGGIWKTTNANATDPTFHELPAAYWAPLTDDQNTMAIGSIAIDPSDSSGKTIYAGTGEGNLSCDSYFGHGVLKTTDAGQTWMHLNPQSFKLPASLGGGQSNVPAFEGVSIRKMVISPNGNVFAAVIFGAHSSATGACDFFGPLVNTFLNGEGIGGVFRSKDGGATWELLDVPNDGTNFDAGIAPTFDMVLDPADPDHHLYVALTDLNNFFDSGVWESTNAAAAAATFTQRVIGLPDLSELGLFTGGGLPPINMTLGIGGNGSAASAATLYLGIASPDAWLFPPAPLFSPFSIQFGDSIGLYPDMVGLFKSTNGGTGTTWSHVDDGQNFTCDMSSLGNLGPCGGSFDLGWEGHAVLVSGGSFPIAPPIYGRLHVFSSASAEIIAPFIPGASLGATVSIGSYPTFCDGSCYKSMAIGVDPQDVGANTVYAGGNMQFFTPNSATPFDITSLWRSDDGANTWTGNGWNGEFCLDPFCFNPIGGVHSGHHAFAFNTGSRPSQVYNGNDGGIWTSTEEGDNFWNDLNTNLSLTTFQSVSTNPLNPEILLGGAQDTGTHLLDQFGTGIFAPSWLQADTGLIAGFVEEQIALTAPNGNPFAPELQFIWDQDGGPTLIDPLDTNRMYHEYFNQSNRLIGPAYTDFPDVPFGFSWFFEGGYAVYPYVVEDNGFDIVDDQVSYYAPMALNPAAGQLHNDPVFGPSVLYYGTNVLYRDADPGSGASPAWQSESYSMTIVPGNALQIGFISAIAPEPLLDINSQESVFTGSNFGAIWRVDKMDNASDATTTTQTEIDGNPISKGGTTPLRFITQIVVDPSDPTGDTIWVTYSGFNSFFGPVGHVYKGTGALTTSTPTWLDMSGDLPDVPVNGIALDPTTVGSLGSPIIYLATDIGPFESLDGGVHYNYISNGIPSVPLFSIERNGQTGQVVAGSHGRGAFQLVANGGPDTTAPACTGVYNDSQTGTGLNLEYDGSATDAAPGDSGVSTVTLLGGSSSPLVITALNFTDLEHASFVVKAKLICVGGTDTVVVTDHAGNTGQCVVTIVPDPEASADLDVFVVDDTNPAGLITSGNNMTLTITVFDQNSVSSLADALNVVVTNNITNANLVSATPTQGSCSGTNLVVCSLGTIANGNIAKITLVLSPNVPVGGTLTDNISVVSDVCDPNLADNSVTDSATVVASVLTPTALSIDDSIVGNSNGVIEAGETFIVDPTWKNDGTAQNKFTGAGTPWQGPIDLLVNLYDITDGSADYGNLLAAASTDCTAATSNCYELALGTPSSTRPAVHWDTFFTETLVGPNGTPNGTVKTWTLHVGDSFTDVPESYGFYKFIETLFHNNVTLGCGTGSNGQGLFCPEATVTRGQMAAFISRALAGGDFNVPTSGAGYSCVPFGSSNFVDVLPTDMFCKHINYIFDYPNKITFGCDFFDDYCPNTLITRGQMAAFIARAIVTGGDVNVPVSGSGYNCISAGSSNFTDVAPTDPFCRHINYLYVNSIINGYGGGLFGPNDFVTRGQASKFMVNGFQLKLYKP